MTYKPDTHKCFADGCNTQIARTLLMCLKHWRMVPFSIRHEIWTYYRKYQEIDNKPSDEYLNAAIRAREAVKEKEARRAKTP